MAAQSSKCDTRVMATVKQRRLAQTLRKYREAADLKPEAVAKELHWDRSKVSRIETVRVKAKPADVTLLLDLYGVTEPHRAALIALSRNAAQRGWWTAFGDVFGGSFVELENDASLIREWQAHVVPGLLQIEDYARAVITADRPGESAEGIQRRVQARMARRSLLGREDGDGRLTAPDLHAVLDESVLRRIIGGPDVMRRQLSDLWASAQKPNVTIQILPFSAGAHSGVSGSFIVLSYADEDDPDVPYSEGPFGDVYPEGAADLARTNVRWDRITDAAMSPQASAELIATLADEMRSSDQLP